jgi:orotate phosphoribosyltransferase
MSSFNETHPYCNYIVLRDRIKRLAYEEGEFTLRSGVKSTYYIDLRKACLDYYVAHLLADALYAEVAPFYPDAVGGMAVGAVPLVAYVVSEYGNRDIPIQGFYVREAAKAYATLRTLEGNLTNDHKVVVLEDVTTTGESALKVVLAVRKVGAEVVGVVTVVDRLQGAVECFKRAGVPFFKALFDITDFGVQMG